MKPNKMLYLSRSDIEAIGLSMDEIIALVEQSMVEKGEGMTELPPKPRLYPKSQKGSFNSLPCIFQRLNLVGFKWQAGFPTNQALGLPHTIGLIVINDIDTGYPIGIMDSTWIVSRRTAAASAVATKYLARKDSTRLAILGCGVQGRTHAEAILKVNPLIKEIKAYDINPEYLRKYVKEISERFGVQCTPAMNPQEAISDAEIIITASRIIRNAEGTIEDRWLKEGVFASPIDYDSYWKKEALITFNKIYTDDIQTLLEHKKYGFFLNLPDSIAELADVVARKKPGRENMKEKIMFMNIGISLSDIIVADKMYKSAIERKIGVELNY